MSPGQVPFHGHVVPDEHTQGLLDNGWLDAHPHARSIYPSASWWRNGALVVDDEGAGLVDADGIRHPLPLPPWGGQLVFATEAQSLAGGVGHANFVFVADEADHAVLLLPSDGVTKELAQGFAEAAGLRFVVPDTYRSQELRGRYGDYQKLPHTYYDLSKTQEDRNRGLGGRLRRLLGTRDSSD